MLFFPLKLLGQVMFAPDNQIRSAISPSAVFQREIVAWWLEDHSAFGSVKTGAFVLGFTTHDAVFKKSGGELGGGIMFKFENHDFWTETSFAFPFATQIYVERDWQSSIGFSPQIKIYSQPRELLRDEYYDPTLMSWTKNQTQINLDIGYSLQHQKDFYLDIFAMNIVRYIITGQEEIFPQKPVYGINTGYLFGKKETKARLGLMAEMSGLSSNTKLMWLLRPNIQILFLDEQFWIKYTLLKANSINTNEFAHRFVVGLGSYWSINFAYTFGNSGIYRNSQGNFELFMSWNLDKKQNPDKTKRGIPCSTKFKKKTKLFKWEMRV